MEKYKVDLKHFIKKRYKKGLPFVIRNFFNKNRISNFYPENLKNKFGNNYVFVNQYRHRHKINNSQTPDKKIFLPINTAKMKFYNFLNKNYFPYFPNHQKNDLYQMKFIPNKNFNSILHFNLPKYFNKNTTGGKWRINRKTLRISMPNWKFPFHFDCIDNLAVQLNGKREFILYSAKSRSPQHIYKYILRPGDALYIPISFYHRVRSIGNDISILCSYTLIQTDSTEKRRIIKKCDNKFDKLWPKQTKRCIQNNCL